MRARTTRNLATYNPGIWDLGSGISPKKKPREGL